MDIDEIVEKMMTAERMPLERMEQDKTTLEWKRDGFRDINKALLELDNMMLDMKLSKTYNSKTVTSSMEGAVTATATTSAANGAYKIEVTELATSEMNVSKKEFEDINTPISELVDDEFEFPEDGKYTASFTTYGENGGNHEIVIDKNDTIKDVLKQIND